MKEIENANSEPSTSSTAPVRSVASYNCTFLLSFFSKSQLHLFVAFILEESAGHSVPFLTQVVASCFRVCEYKVDLKTKQNRKKQQQTVRVLLKHDDRVQTGVCVRVRA